MSSAEALLVNGLSWFFWSRSNPVIPSVSESLFSSPEGFTIASVKHHLRSATGTATFDFELRHGPTVTTGGGTLVVSGAITSTNTPATITSFNSADIAADEVVWVDFDAIVNQPAEELTIRIVLA